MRKFKIKNKDKITESLTNLKSKRHLVKPIFWVTIIILLQFALLIYLSNIFKGEELLINYLWSIVSYALIIYIINLNQPIEYRVAWIIPIAILPVAGFLIYLVFEIFPGPKRLKRKLEKIKESSSYLLVKDDKILQEIDDNKKINNGIEKYLQNTINYPIYKNTNYKYFSSGEEYFEKLLEDLENAQEFIFLEYFIVRPGKMLEQILDKLIDKVNEGVKVKIMYDGINDYYLPDNYKEFLLNLGFEVQVFSAVTPILSTVHNNRDHRKIVSIDNKIAYTGGLNLADEYINEIARFGHWKDNGIRIEGEAVRSITVMFLNLWNLSKYENSDYEKYLKNVYKVDNNDYVQPFDDSPNDGETVGENVYADIINRTKNYVYIMTPYLILSEKIKDAMIFAAKRGVDIQILMPGIPDKKVPYIMARSNYEQLLFNGVKIYEYIPGFLHSKSIIADDLISVVGTINLDFRSLHLHYENAILFYSKNLAKIIKNDFEKTRNLSREVTYRNYKDYSIFYRFLGKILKLVAPLM
ncbi:cardiolipin synthase [Helcococcus bovis]|uniref:cardiolipin synthase n=1 Tax=Helcococcus bovis TaxID=3153252 RepID=UPI0038BC5424